MRISDWSSDVCSSDLDDVTPWVGLPSGDKSRKREARRRPLERLAGETCRRLASLALQRGHAGWSLWPRGVPLPGSTCAGNCPARRMPRVFLMEGAIGPEQALDRTSVVSGKGVSG